MILTSRRILPLPHWTENEQSSVSIGGWLHLFMTYAATRAERNREDGSHHILTMHAQKGPRVGLEYDYRFRVRRERTDTPWNLFNYPLYASVKAKCNAKAANTSVSAQTFREYASGSTRPGQIADTKMDVPSAKRRGIVSSSAGARLSFPTAEPITEAP